MQKKIITIEIPEGADISRAKRHAEMSVDPDYLLSVWHIDDVKSNHFMDFDECLTEEECRHVLRLVEKYHDANIGINWEVISYHAQCVLDEREEANAS